MNSDLDANITTLSQTNNRCSSSCNIYTWIWYTTWYPNCVANECISHTYSGTHMHCQA